MNPPRITPTALAVLLLLLMSSTGTAAQSLRFDAELGIARTTFEGEGVRDLDEQRTGWLAGLGIGYDVGGIIEIESGLAWVERGATGSVQGFEEPITADVQLSYLSLPVALRLTPLSGRALRPSLSAGPTIAFEVRCRTAFDESVLALLVTCEDEARPSVDVGFRTGAGVVWTVGGVAMLVEARYELGFRDLDTVERLGARHRSGSLVSRLSVPRGG